MMVAPMASDGDCLFHALAFGGDCGLDGAALRLAVADYMENHAWSQDGFEEEWLAEAETLHGGAWAGPTAITAYSLMTERRVVVHKRQVVGASYTVEIEEATHAAVGAGASTAHPQHILYVGENHYDALLFVEPAGDLEPAWPQQPPPQYDCRHQRSSRGALPPAALGWEAGPLPREAACAHRPSGSPRLAPRPRKRKGGASGGRAFAEQEAAEKQRPVRRRHAEKSAPPPELRDDLATELAHVPVAPGLRHPHRRQEDLVKASWLRLT